MVTMADGSVQYQLRTESDISIEMLNVTEKQRFMDGEKSIAVISEAASSGISLQADKRVKVIDSDTISNSLSWCYMYNVHVHFIMELTIT